jgi:hypothetical protein
VAAHRHHTTLLAHKQTICSTWTPIIHGQQSRCGYPQITQNANTSVNVNVGCRFDKQHLSGVQCHLPVIIDPQRHLRRAVRARLHFRIVHRPRHLPYQSNYQPAALRQVAHTLDGTRLALMELDRSCQVPVTRVWTRRSNTT